MGKTCSICGSLLHNTDAHNYWLEREKAQSPLSDPRVVELVEAADEFTNEELVTAIEFSRRRERVRKALAAMKEG